MKKKYLLFISLLLLISQVIAQNFSWVKSISKNSEDIYIKDVAIDHNDNIIISGTFIGLVDFDPGVNVFNLNASNRSMFIAKFNTNGDFIWAKSMTGLGTSDCFDLDLDSTGNIYYTGTYQGVIDFDPGIGTYNQYNSLKSMVTSKLDSNGNFVWANTTSPNSNGNSDYVIGESIYIDKSGNVLISGRLRGSADFDPGSTNIPLTSISYSDLFLQKLDSNGNLILAKIISKSFIYHSKVETDKDNNIYITASFNDSTQFNSNSITNLISYGYADIMVLKLDSTGGIVWGKSLGSSTSDGNASISIDKFGNVYVAGVFSNTLYNSENSQALNLVGGSYQNTDVFIVKIDSNSNFIWQRSIGGYDYDNSTAIKLSKDSKSIYIVGSFQDEVDFNPGTGIETKTADGDRSSFMLKLNYLGNYEGVITNQDYGSDFVNDISLNGTSLTLVGYFHQGRVDFDPDTSVFDLHSWNDKAGYIQKFNYCSTPFYDTLNITKCFKYVAFNGSEFTSNGTYVDTIKDFYGCDTIRTIHLSLLNNYSSTTYYVTNPNDDGCGTLRDFVRNASHGDTIIISTDSIIQLDSSITISKNLTIVGKQSLSVIRSTSEQTIFVTNSDKVNLFNISFQNSRNGPWAPAVHGKGDSLIITNCFFYYNESAIGCNRNLVVNSSSFSKNENCIILSNTSNTQIINCEFFDNNLDLISKGMITNKGGNLKIIHSNFKNNRGIRISGYYEVKGAIIKNEGTVELWYCNFENNVGQGGLRASKVYGGVLYNDSLADINFCNFIKNEAYARSPYNHLYVRGGAIYNNGFLKVNNSTFHRNNAYAYADFNNHKSAYAYGGAIFNADSLVINNSTFSNNYLTTGLGASSLGGQYKYGRNIYGGKNFIKNSTISGDPLYSGTLTISNCIINNNSPLNSFTSLGYNIINHGDSNLAAINDSIGTQSVPLDAGLDSIGYFGGFTLNYSLRNNSVAINKGSPLAPLRDQRGFSRSNLADAGAHESNGVNHCTNLIDSVYAKNLSCYNSSDGEIELFLSSNNFYVFWNNGSNELTQNNLSSGQYSYVLFDSLGCVLRDTLSIVQPNRDTTINPEIIICDGDSILLFDSYKSSAGTYYDTLQTIHGCDSILATSIFVNHSYETILNDTICNGDSVLIYNSYRKSSGYYSDTLQTINGCDSIFTTNLFVNPNFTSTFYDTICEGDSLLIYGVYQNTPGIYYDTLQLISGCDSILETILTVNPNLMTYYNESICEGDSLLVYGGYQNTSGVYYDTLQSISGCDSILETTLIVNPNLVTYYNESICEGDSLLVYGVYRNISGVYYDTLQSISGCDSTLETILNVYPNLISHYNESICEGDSVLIYGVYQNSSGVYYDTLQSISSCDSVLETNLIVRPTYLVNFSDSICQGDSSLINGVYRFNSGIYIDTLQTLNTCDSIVKTLLTVNSLPNVSLLNFENDTTCYNISSLIIPEATPSGGEYLGNNGVFGNFFVPELAGIGNHNIIYVYTDTNLCQNSDTISISVDMCTNINDLNSIFGINIFPNPSNGIFTIKRTDHDLSKKVKIKLLDASSKLILEDVIKSNERNLLIDIRDYSKGLYYLQFYIDDKQVVKQLIKN